MPVSPELGERLATRIVVVYAEAERELLAKVARRVARGIEEEGWAERKLAEITDLRREAQITVRSLGAKAAEEIPTIVDDAYQAGATEARKDLKRLGGSEFVVATNPRLVRTLALETVEKVTSTHLRILRSTDDIYRRTIAAASAQVTTGALTRREAAQRALSGFANNGITGFVDATGRRWEMASYVEMSTRASTGRAAVTAHADALAGNGHDLVIVSDSPGECPLCRPWEGQVLSLSGRDPRYASLGDAEGGGLFHPACTHSLGIYVPGFTRPMGRTEDAVEYENRQELRYLERGVRQWRRREAVALSSGERARAAAKVREWQTKTRAHVAANDLKRKRHRERLGAR
jgi:hypothetical protein